MEIYFLNIKPHVSEGVYLEMDKIELSMAILND